MTTITTMLLNANAVCHKAEWYWLSKGNNSNAELVRIYNDLLDCKVRDRWDFVLDEDKAAAILGCKPEEVEEALYERGILVR